MFIKSLETETKVLHVLLNDSEELKEKYETLKQKNNILKHKLEDKQVHMVKSMLGNIYQ